MTKTVIKRLSSYVSVPSWEEKVTSSPAVSRVPLKDGGGGGGGRRDLSSCFWVWVCVHGAEK